jgi:ribonuclease M5
MRPKAFVVEGKNDQSRLKKIFKDVMVVTTNGSAMNEAHVELIKTLDQTHDIILFLDPDHAGERIRRLLSKDLKHVYHAFLEQKDAYSKNMKKIGIEHASDEVILEALTHIKIEHESSKSDIDMSFLFDMKLIGHPHSKEKRAMLSNTLKIGHVNGKTLLERLKRFHIMQKEIIEVFK